MGIIVMGTGSHGDRHLGMGASSPKMRIEKRKSVAASVSLQQNIMYKIIYSPKAESVPTASSSK